MKENTLYEEMTRNCCEWEKAKQERKARKQEIINMKGWDSPELSAWYEEDKAAAFPYTSGQMKAYWAVKNSLELDELEMKDSCWDSEWHDFIDTLRKMGIRQFTVTTNSTGLMEDLFGYVREGCVLLGLHTITKQTDLWGQERTEEIKGILLEIR